MSEQQISQILKAMADQNKVLEAIQAEQKDAREKMEAMELKLEPVHRVFESVSGFNQTAVWILKGLILLGAGMGVIYGLIRYLKE